MCDEKQVSGVVNVAFKLFCTVIDGKIVIDRVDGKPITEDQAHTLFQFMCRPAHYWLPARGMTDDR